MGQKPLKSLIEIAILSDEISPPSRLVNRAVISLSQVRCLFISDSSVYNEAVLLLLLDVWEIKWYHVGGQLSELVQGTAVRNAA